MNKALIAALFGAAAMPGVAQAQLSGNANIGRIPALKAACPENMQVETKDGGPILLNGKEGNITIYNKDFATASLDTIIVTVEMDANDAVSMTYDNKKTGNNDYCRILPGDIILNGKKIN